MKREGRQHGMVRAYLVHPDPSKPQRRIVNLFDSPATANLCVKVPSKPTNHSKFTGKCGRPRCRGCNSHPVCKSLDKVKGAHKLRSKTTCFVIDDGRLPGLKALSGFSGTGALDYLDREDGGDDLEEEEEQGEEISPEIVEDEGLIGVDNDVNMDDDEEDGMSFCEVGFVLETVLDEDESWCLVAEM